MTDPHAHNESIGEPSAAGMLRRDVMLARLLNDMRRVHARRRARRRIAFTTAPALLVGVALFALLRALAPSPSPSHQVGGHQHGATDPAPPASDRPAAVIMLVRTGDAESHSDAADITLVNDDELLAMLAEMNRPTGLVRTGQRVWLTSAVADDAPRRGSSS